MGLGEFLYNNDSLCKNLMNIYLLIFVFVYYFLNTF